MKRIKLGSFALNVSGEALCNGEALIVSHDKKTLRQLAPISLGNRYMNVYLADCIQGITLGAIYDFDPSSFKLILPYLDVELMKINRYEDFGLTFHRVVLLDDIIL